MGTQCKAMAVAVMLSLASAVAAQETEIENNVPLEAEATTAIVPGQEHDADAAPPSAAQATPDRIYTDGALANPKPRAEDLGMASPGNKTIIDAK